MGLERVFLYPLTTFFNIHSLKNGSSISYCSVRMI